MGYKNEFKSNISPRPTRSTTRRISTNHQQRTKYTRRDHLQRQYKTKVPKRPRNACVCEVQQSIPRRQRAEIAPPQGAPQAEAVRVRGEDVQGEVLRALQPVEAREVGARAAAAAHLRAVRARVLRAQQAGQARGDRARRAAPVRVLLARLQRGVRPEVRPHAPHQRRAPQPAPLPVPRMQEIWPQVEPRAAPAARARHAHQCGELADSGREQRAASAGRFAHRNCAAIRQLLTCAVYCT